MIKVDLKSIQSVKDFVNVTNNFTGEVILKSERYIVNGKSIMGIFSLDLSKPIIVEVIPEEKTEEFKKAVEKFLVD